MKREELKEIFPSITDELADKLEKSEQDAYERGWKDAEAECKQAEFERELNSALINSAAKNVKALKALLDISRISYENGKINGLSEQLEQIKKDSGYLFEDGGKKPEFTSGNRTADIEAKAFENLSYKKRLKLFRENPELYHSLSR